LSAATAGVSVVVDTRSTGFEEGAIVEQTVQPVHVPPGGGDTVFFVGDTYTTLLSGAQTGGTFAMLEALVPAQTGPPPHIHHAEDETFILLDGVIDFHVADDVHRAEPGSVIFVPRGTQHHFSNAGDSVARMLFMYSPAGMEGMFAEIGSPGSRGVQAPPLSASDLEALARVADKYRFSIVAD
jgi:quercetin dioxygenase-like cupin family protein